MASPINELHAQLKAAQKEIDRYKRKDEQSLLVALKAELDYKQKANMFLRIAARQELRASMITSFFAKHVESVAEDLDNARTLSELKTWLKTDFIDKFNHLLVKSNELDRDAQDWEEKASDIATGHDIKFNKDSINNNLVEIIDEYKQAYML
jgi:hypothetical protein